MHEQVWDLIDKSHYITLISHLNPDGDSLGCALAFYPTLKKMGKNVSLFNATHPVAKKYDFLPNFSKMKSSFPKKCDLLISFDCGGFDRLGISKGDFKIINIDHHKSNTLFGDINILNFSASSATIIVYEILKSKNSTITKDEAICIYTGLVEDTGFFTFGNTNQIAFDIASELISYGVIPSQIAQNLKMRNSLAKTRLTAIFINSFELLKDGQIAIGNVTVEDFRATGALRSDSDHLVDILRNLATVELAIFILEQKNGGLKVSLRSKNRVDVSEIALFFGGGGHQRAAGFESEAKDISSLIEKIIQKVSL